MPKIPLLSKPDMEDLYAVYTRCMYWDTILCEMDDANEFITLHNFIDANQHWWTRETLDGDYISSINFSYRFPHLCDKETLTFKEVIDIAKQAYNDYKSTWERVTQYVNE